MKPTLVSKPLRFPPGKCLVTNRADGELIDFGCDFVGIDPHVYLKTGVVEKAAIECLGMVRGEDLVAAQVERDELREENLEQAATLKVKPLLEDVFAEDDLRELAYQVAGATASPLLQDNPDYELPAERIKAAVEAVLAQFLTAEETSPAEPEEG